MGKETSQALTDLINLKQHSEEGWELAHKWHNDFWRLDELTHNIAVAGCRLGIALDGAVTFDKERMAVVEACEALVAFKRGYVTSSELSSLSTGAQSLLDYEKQALDALQALTNALDTRGLKETADKVADLYQKLGEALI